MVDMSDMICSECGRFRSTREKSIDVDVDRDKVEINGTIIPRPSKTAPSAWLSFWESVRTMTR